MRKHTVGTGLIAVSLLGMTGCQDLPGTREQQGAAIGGLGGAAVGAAVGGSEHRLLGALLGGAVGAGGGYLIGANMDRIKGNDRDSATAAARKAEQQPATAQDALNARTADLNNDGFVTMDEVVALNSAGLSDAVIIERLRATNQVFELTDDQRQFLTDRGVSRNVVNQMETINQDQRQRLLSEQGDVIGRQP